MRSRVYNLKDILTAGDVYTPVFLITFMSIIRMSRYCTSQPPDISILMTRNNSVEISTALSYYITKPLAQKTSQHSYNVFDFFQ
jgi:serine kinase of HPr protein (carbohydrate metabolism regulator)